MGQETTPTTELTEPVEALLEAAKYDDFEDVKSLEATGVSLDSKDSQGRIEWLLLCSQIFPFEGSCKSTDYKKVSVIATTVFSSEGRRRLFAQINSFIAIFILAGQLTLTMQGHILTVAGITVAICSAPVVAFPNFVALFVWPTWVAVSVSDTLWKVVTYVVTRPGRELLFSVVSQEEKYKAKICIDVQRLGDAAAAGMYKLLFQILDGKMSTVSLSPGFSTVDSDSIPPRPLSSTTCKEPFCFNLKV